MDKHTGAILSGPDLTQRGFLHQPNNEEFLAEATRRVRDRLGELNNQPMGDEQGVARLIRETLSSFISTSVRRKPMILPVVLEV
jgi:ribonuclease J